MFKLHTLLVLTLVYSSLLCAHAEPEQAIAATTADNVKIYANAYFGELDNSAPLILLFHQAGSNGRGEYASLIPWLNNNGFRAMVWDQRSGGDLYGQNNRTVNHLAKDTPAGFCDAYVDLQTALDYVIAAGIAEKVIAWGSSYSAALVFQLAAKNSDQIAGVLAFSPASGGPLEKCRARQWLDQIRAPVLALRPETEMQRSSSIEQRDIFTAAGVDFQVIKNGVHGSSMLVDERTEHDMSSARATVIKWLSNIKP